MKPLEFLSRCVLLVVTAVCGSSLSAAADDLPKANTPPAAPAATTPATTIEPFELRDGDRVIFLGDTLIERAQASGYIETLLTAWYPDRHVTFRNLGWSGDTVFGEARAGFGPPEAGFPLLQKQVEGLKPTHVILGYGGASAFDGPAGLPRFKTGLDRLLQMLAVTKADITILSPLLHEDHGAPLPDPTPQNANRKLYAQALQQAAQARGLRYVSLLGLINVLERTPDQALQLETAPPGTGRTIPAARLTDNGIHLTDYGYWRAASEIARGLGLARSTTTRMSITTPTPTAITTTATTSTITFWQPAWSVTVSVDGQQVMGVGTKVDKLTVARNGIRFEAQDATLPQCPIPDKSGDADATYHRQPRMLKLTGLEAGNYVLKIDGQPAARGSAADWAQGVDVHTGPQFDQVEKLRRTIIAKNRLYFYRWRPQNETYLFGFRKHEQGNNAVEIPQFDPLVDAKEQEIAKLRVPASHQYEIVREP